MSLKLKRDLRDQQQTIRNLTVTNMTQRVLIESVSQLLDSHQVDEARSRLRRAIDGYNNANSHAHRQETDKCHH